MLERDFAHLNGVTSSSSDTRLRVARPRIPCHDGLGQSSVRRRAGFAVPQFKLGSST